MKQIDFESEQFIDWSMQKLKDEAFFNYLTQKVSNQMQSFYLDGSRKKLLKKLREKMEAGAVEHGEPKTDFEEVKKELEEEYLDLIGWSMLLLWGFEKRLGKKI